MKNGVKKFIEFCKGLKFTAGDSIGLFITEDIINISEKYLADKITEAELIKKLAIIGCPNDEYKDYSEICIGQGKYCCEKCWKLYLKN